MGGGIVVPSGSADHLADAINTLITDTDLASNMGQKGRQLLSTISLKNAVNELEDICSLLAAPER
jgi:glycosyltransferase involved in cell wall biosynthesis